jgi:GDP-L-fucose synthase
MLQEPDRMSLSHAVPFDLRGKRVWVAGHRGMVGSALVRRLGTEHCEILTVPRDQVDLRRQADVERWMDRRRPEVVFLAAATVGGIVANDSRPADFIYENLAIATNIIAAAHQMAVAKLLFLSSSCVYPRLAPQPMREDALLTGPLEPTNQWYAVAKIAGMKMIEAYRRQYGSDFISAMPTNLYGRGDNYHPEHSHVPAALIRRFHGARMAGAPRTSVWGTGRVRREFLNVDDLADACVFLMTHYSSDETINVGVGEDITIADFARLVAEVVGYTGVIDFDPERPDGTPQKLLDVSKLAGLGWRAKTPLREGLAAAYADFLAGEGRFR